MAPQVVVHAKLDVAKLTDEDVVYDLGCGDGRIVITGARRFAERAVGIDHDPRLLEHLAPGTRIVTHKYRIPGWRPLERVKVKKGRIYLYVVP